MGRKHRASHGLRIGELAASSGVTVRTLHYYEEIGLLAPAARTETRHRLYGDAEVTRLYRISLLRQLGLSLAEIRNALDDSDWDLRASIGAHLLNTQQRLDTERRLHHRLSQLLDSSEADGGGLTDGLLAILEDMTMLDNNVQSRISTLVYEDLQVAYDYLERVFGLGPGRITKNDAGLVVHAEIEAGDGLVWLHPESADYRLASPNSLGAATACVSVMVDDVDAHFAHAKSEGADVVYEPVDQPYGYREYSARDAEGHLWSFMKAIE